MSIDPFPVSLKRKYRAGPTMQLIEMSTLNHPRAIEFRSKAVPDKPLCSGERNRAMVPTVIEAETREFHQVLEVISKLINLR
ncbi:MAG: hypothetical protein EBZ48_06475 [Proteobacteria bacterium]|nr:hypothetical protein [Pseudomonadota bacterium]